MHDSYTEGARAAGSLTGFFTDTPWWGWPVVALALFAVAALTNIIYALYVGRAWSGRAIVVLFGLSCLVVFPILILRNIYAV